MSDGGGAVAATTRGHESSSIQKCGATMPFSHRVFLLNGDSTCFAKANGGKRIEREESEGRDISGFCGGCGGGHHHRRSLARKHKQRPPGGRQQEEEEESFKKETKGCKGLRYVRCGRRSKEEEAQEEKKTIERLEGLLE